MRICCCRVINILYTNRLVLAFTLPKPHIHLAVCMCVCATVCVCVCACHSLWQLGHSSFILIKQIPKTNTNSILKFMWRVC